MSPRSTRNEAWIAKARAVKIEDEIARRGVRLRRQGVELVGPCPKCSGDDRFAINTEKQVWNCRGCGKGGDVIKLVQHLDGCGFKAACATLAGEPPSETKGNGSTKPWSPIVARYVYRQADGSLHLQVCRTAAKTFFQNRWNGQMWVSGAPEGAKIPYRLPELMAAPLTMPVHITEGEKDAENLAKLGFIATTNTVARPTGATISTSISAIGPSASTRTMTTKAVSGCSGSRALSLSHRGERARDQVAGAAVERRRLELAAGRSVRRAAGQRVREHAGVGPVERAREGADRRGWRRRRDHRHQEKAGGRADRTRVGRRAFS